MNTLIESAKDLSKPVMHLIESVQNWPHLPTHYTDEHIARMRARIESGKFVCLTDRSTWAYMQEQIDE